MTSRAATRWWQWLLCSVLLLIARNGFAQSEWVQLGGEQFNACAILNDSLYFLVGDLGKIISSNDLHHWNTIASNRSDDLLDVTFTQRGTGLICGRNGVVLRSIDSGTTWRRVPTSSSASFDKIYSLSNSLVLSEKNKPLLQSKDDGKSWQQLSSSIDTAGVAVFPLSDGSFVTIRHTSITKQNGGRGLTEELWHSAGEEIEQSWIAGDRLILIYTKSHKLLALDLAHPNDLRSLSIARQAPPIAALQRDSDLYVVTGDSLLRYSAIDLSAKPSTGFHGLLPTSSFIGAAATRSVILCVGAPGLIAYTSENGQHIVAQSPIQDSIYGTDKSTKILARDDDHIAVYSHSKLYLTEDGGVTWNIHLLEPFLNLHTMVYASDTLLYGFGETKGVKYFTNSNMASYFHTPAAMRGSFFDGWKYMLWSDTTIYQFDSLLDTVLTPLRSSHDLVLAGTSMHDRLVFLTATRPEDFASPIDLDSIAILSDVNETYRTFSAPPGRFRLMQASSTDLLMILADSGRAMVSQDQGNSWNRMTFGPRMQMTSVGFGNDSLGIITTDKSIDYISRDAGRSWNFDFHGRSMPAQTPRYLSGSAALSNNSWILVGKNTIIASHFVNGSPRFRRRSRGSTAVANPALDVSVFPNPATDKIQITVHTTKSSGNLDIKIIDLLANQVAAPPSLPLNGTDVSCMVDIAYLPVGSYYVQCSDGTASTVKRFVVLRN